MHTRVRTPDSKPLVSLPLRTVRGEVGADGGRGEKEKRKNVLFAAPQLRNVNIATPGVVTP